MSMVKRVGAGALGFHWRHVCEFGGRNKSSLCPPRFWVSPFCHTGHPRAWGPARPRPAFSSSRTETWPAHCSEPGCSALRGPGWAGCPEQAGHEPQERTVGSPPPEVPACGRSAALYPNRRLSSWGLRASTLEFGGDTMKSISSIQSLSRVWLFATPWITARQASLPITNSRSPPKLMSI